MTVLREIVAHFGVTADDTALRRLDTTIDRVKGALGTLGVALGASQLVSFVQQAAAAADDLGDTAERLSISTQALQEWGYAAKLSGSSAEEFQGSISHLVRSLSEAGSGGDEAQKAFRKLGVQVKDSSGHLRRVDDLLPDIADGIAKIENPTERAALAMRVFGRGAQPLVPLLARGAAGVEELRKEFRELGGGLSPETIDQASDYADQLDRFNVVLTSLKSKVLNSFLPAFQRAAESITRGAQLLSDLTGKTYALETALGVVAIAAGAFSSAWAAANKAVLLSMGPLLAKVALLAVAFLAIEDVVTFLNGGDSVLGDFLASITQLQDPLAAVKGTWDEIVVSISDALGYIVEIARWLPAVGLVVRAAEKLTTGRDITDTSFKPNVSRQSASERFRSQQDERGARGKAALESGDFAAFIAARRPGESQEEARDRFKNERRDFVTANPGAANANDVAAGFVSNVGVGAASISTEKRGKGHVQVLSPTTITVNLPPGSDHEQAERIRKVFREEQDRRDRKSMASVAEEAL